jgi:hypothetical protein
MPIKVNIKTRIRFNGLEYDSVEAMPPEARAVYERALASVSGARGQPPAAQSITTKVIFNGREYASPEEMPPEVRARCDTIMGRLDADHNGVPDVLEGGKFPAGAVLVSQAAQPADPAGADDAASAWLENLAKRQTQAPAAVQSPASFPVVSGESSGSRRLVITAVALLVLLAGVIVMGLLLWSQLGNR